MNIDRIEQNKELIEKLIQEAFEARKSSYSPYSQFIVGAALLCKDGTIIRGCNVENSSDPATNCAERTAIFSAVANGKREYEAIAIVGGKDNCIEMCYPCGICRQVMAEFCKPEHFIIIAATSQDEYELYTLEQLLPKSFHL